MNTGVDTVDKTGLRDTRTVCVFFFLIGWVVAMEQH